VRRALPHLVALLIGATAAFAVGCGDRSNLLPAAKASSLSNRLDQIRQAVADGDCQGATSALDQAQSVADSLPANVSRALRKRINDGLDQLRVTVPRDCKNVTTTETTTTPTVTTATETTPTVTTTTTTPTPTTTATTPTETTPTTTTPTPPSQTTTSPDTGGAAPGDGGTGGTP
jgi:hypothetical protein